MRSSRWLPHRPNPAPRFVGMGLLLALALWLLTPQIASAHAHLVEADPAPDNVIAHAPAIGSFLFDEPLNPALTRVRIVDASGRQVTTNPGYLGPGHGGKLWDLPLPALRPGTYSVFWTSESATDGHVMSSFYTFTISPSGGADSTGAVTGVAAGVYGGASGSAAGLSGGLLAMTFFTWLGSMAQALWLGALIVELAILAPARRAAGSAEARLAQAATPRLWWLVRAAPVLIVWALLGEVVTLALQGTGGDWGQALASATLGGILSSQNGHIILLRCAVLLVALLVAGRVRTPAAATGTAASAPRLSRSHKALGIAAPLAVTPNWEATRYVLAGLAAVYLLLAAFSGHASDVSPGWLAYPIDWLHLLTIAAWVGGIATLAHGVMPARRALSPEERAPAVLPLLDRFSPVACIAIAVLALSGLYNAVNHVASPAALGNTTYGQLLVLKIVLVGVLMILSASHVWGHRPGIARAQRKATRNSVARILNTRIKDTRSPDAGAVAAMHEGLATLAARLRLEAGVGAAILLATALMTQTLPPTGSAATAPSLIPASINGAATAGDLRGQFSVTPPAVGTTTFMLNLWQNGTPITSDGAAAIIHLFPMAEPTSRATLDPVGQGARFVARGSLATTGTWRADVLVRTAAVPNYRTLPFTFTVGPGATFLAAGVSPATVSIAVTPGRLLSPNTFIIAGVQGPAVQLLSQSLDMYMGSLSYPATSLGGGRWRVSNVDAPMNGRWGLTVQVRQGGLWSTVRQFVYQVPLSGPMQLLTPQASTAAVSALLGAPPPVGPIVHLAGQAGWLTVNLIASAGQLTLHIVAPDDVPAHDTRLSLAMRTPTGRERSLAPATCGPGCFSLSVAWPRGATRLRLGVTTTNWAGGTLTLTVPWPPVRSNPGLLAGAIATMRAQRDVAIRESIVNGPRAVGQHTYRISGATFMASDPDDAGSTDIGRLPDEHGLAQIVLYLPHVNGWVHLWLDRRRRFRREVIVVPGYVIQRTFAYLHG